MKGDLEGGNGGRGPRGEVNSSLRRAGPGPRGPTISEAGWTIGSWLDLCTGGRGTPCSRSCERGGMVAERDTAGDV